MKTRTLVCLCGALAAWPLVEASAQAPALTPRDSALHALNRLAYGPRPGEVDRVAADGVMRWIDRQLSPGKIDDGPLAARERRFKILDYDAGELARVYVDAQRERREQKRAAATDSMTEKPEQAGPLEQRGRRLGAEFQELAVIRAVLSERQLYEVMVDFWANHFNVFFAKGADRFLTPSYIEQTIRPRALGKFADLLIATAESPAMLFYLDNWESVAPGATPPQAMRLRARPLFGPRPMFGRPPLFDPGHDPMRADSLRRQALARVPKGINENYARELLELHTLGVDGGYTQQDVINVARIFTGWSVRRPQQGGDFEFHDWAHDYGEKVVMGVMFPAGRGRDEGVRLLKLLANYPATMHHVSRRLCQRFVNDDPPDGCVDDAVTAWKRSDGDIREVLRAIFRSPDFWAPENVRAKIKTPLEFVVSAARAVGGDPDTTPRLAQVVARLGEPLFLHVAPDGYPEREDAWVNSGALLDRMNAAVALAAGRLPGVAVSLDSIVPATPDAERLIAQANAAVLSGTMSENTKQVIRRQISDISDPLQARALAIGLAIGGPEFQRQ
ncbi:MAG: hypothetical protein AUF60_02525 [Gemmatimonadetes bacterium 13_1_20CM_69_28]|nr:MAG: hypothetical protein AUF60_02525 [Gemmatimonadetes bacterium 13_1_20CM_69_28]